MTIELPAIQRFRPHRRKLFAGVTTALLLAGLAGAAVAQAPPPSPPVGAPPPAPPAAAAPGQPQPVMLLTPVAIGKLEVADVVAVKGSVTEIYGNKFVLQDDTGRMLVDLGPQGDGANVVIKGEQVAVQGRFDRGFIAAQVVSHADGRNQAFGPPRPDREADRGPGRSPGRRPPPPPAPR